MKYRITLSVGFDDQAEANIAWDWIKARRDKFKNIASGEPWYIEIHKCYHDEDPVRPCELIKRFSGG